MKQIFVEKIGYDPQICDFCGTCVAVCPHDAIDLFEADFHIDEKCTVCRNCIHVCPVRALELIDEG